MKILGIETSCDETAASVVENGRLILSNEVATSAQMHAKTGGIIPEQAARQQLKSIIPIVDLALKNANCDYHDIDALAVTIGPGLIGSLLVGVETAKTLSYVWKKPIIRVNHLIGHIYAGWLNGEQSSSKNAVPKFPILALVVSGGHTDLVLMPKHGKIKWIGGTRDDAAGEAFDKTARLLGLPYPGGPAISSQASKFHDKTNSKIKLPRPLINEETYDFSFSGLKTAVLREVEDTKNIKKRTPELAYKTQEAITDVLVDKTIKAVREYKPKSLIVAGGVAANQRLRQKFQLKIKKWKLKTTLFIPSPKLCTDNAAYIASCAYFNQSTTSWQKLDANPELTITGEV